MQSRIKIIGAGLSGLVTAYYLDKLLPATNQSVQIEIYDQHDESEENASTISFAWINAAYPCKDQNPQNNMAYDKFRLESLRDWKVLSEMLRHDGIHDVIATEQQAINIEQQAINSLYVFFGSEQQQQFMKMMDRLPGHDGYHANIISPEKISAEFPFLKKMQDRISICNLAKELLINPYYLRNQLIQYLQNKNVQFHWNSPITMNDIQSEPHTQWILAAGNGVLPLVKNTRLENIDFIKDSPAEVIYCDLSKPLDLKGKMFHFAASKNTPGFHFRNMDSDATKIKIVVEHGPHQANQPEKNAQDIFDFLQLPVKQYHCIHTIKRPMTHDSRPLIEYQLGENKNIHLVYGHNLYTNSAKLYRHFACGLASYMNQKFQQPVFITTKNQGELEQFYLTNRFFSPQKYNLAQSGLNIFAVREMESKNVNSFPAMQARL